MVEKLFGVNDAVLQVKNQKNIYITGVDVGLLSIFALDKTR